MKKRSLVVGMLALSIGGAAAFTLRAAEKGGEEKGGDKEVKVTIDQVPAPVKATLSKEAGDGKILDIEKESDDNKVVYEADVQIGTRFYELKVAEDGTLKCMKYEEDRVALDQVPAPVRATLQQRAGDGKIEEVKKETEKGKTTYEAEATIGGKEYEIEVAEDGALLVKKLKEKEEGEKDKKKDEDHGKKKGGKDGHEKEGEDEKD